MSILIFIILVLTDWFLILSMKAKKDYLTHVSRTNSLSLLLNVSMLKKMLQPSFDYILESVIIENKVT